MDNCSHIRCLGILSKLLVSTQPSYLSVGRHNEYWRWLRLPRDKETASVTSLVSACWPWSVQVSTGLRSSRTVGTLSHESVRGCEWIQQFRCRRGSVIPIPIPTLVLQITKNTEYREKIPKIPNCRYFRPPIIFTKITLTAVLAV